MMCSLVSLATLCGTTARSSSGRSADAPRHANSPTAIVARPVTRAQPGTSASQATRQRDQQQRGDQQDGAPAHPLQPLPGQLHVHLRVIRVHRARTAAARLRRRRPTADTSPSTRQAPTGTRARDPGGVLRRPDRVIAERVRRHGRPPTGSRSAARRVSAQPARQRSADAPPPSQPAPPATPPGLSSLVGQVDRDQLARLGGGDVLGDLTRPAHRRQLPYRGAATAPPRSRLTRSLARPAVCPATVLRGRLTPAPPLPRFVVSCRG